MKEFQWSRIKFGDRVIPQIGEKNVILHNVNKDKTVKITKEVYDVVDQICSFDWKIEDVINNCKTQADREYLLDNLTYLAENCIIREKDDFTEYDDMGIKIDWDITNRCNLRCKHCCVSANIENNDLDGDVLEDVIDKIASLNPATICISGGEPLIRKDFKNIIIRLKEKYHGHLSLMTNAVLIDEKMAQFISRNFNFVSVSLDGVDEETCAHVRGQGVFAKTIAGIQRLQNAGMTKISVSMIVSKITYKYKKQFIDMCKSMKVEPVLRSLALVGRAAEEMKNMIPDEQEELVCEQDEHREEKKDEHGKEEKKTKNKVPLFVCGAAFKQFQIDYKGNIYPCQSLMEDELLLGNVLEIEDFNAYIRKRLFKDTEGYRKLEEFFPYNFKECRGCNKQIFCWNCIGTIYREKKKIEGCNQYSCLLDRYWE